MEKSEAIIAVLLVIAIVASIASMVIMNSKVSSVTGKATGNVNASINSLVSFVLSPDQVNFGAVDQLSSHDTADGGEPAPFGVTNNGTVNIDIDVKMNAALFSGTSPVFQFYANCTEASCATTEAGYTNFTTGDQEALGVFKFAENADAATIGVKITVPMDEPAGNKTSIITFTGTEA